MSDWYEFQHNEVISVLLIRRKSQKRSVGILTLKLLQLLNLIVVGETLRQKRYHESSPRTTRQRKWDGKLSKMPEAHFDPSVRCKTRVHHSWCTAGLESQSLHRRVTSSLVKCQWNNTGKKNEKPHFTIRRIIPKQPTVCVYIVYSPIRGLDVCKVIYYCAASEWSLMPHMTHDTM